MTKVLYPGSFDPITKGHMNIIEQASTLFDEIVVTIMQNPTKTTSFFTAKERLEMINKLYKNNDNIKVILGDGATVDVAMKNNCKAIIRGLRSLSDYDYEIGLQQFNKEISKGAVNTVCLFADKEFQFVSSNIVKEIFDLGKDITNYVDSFVLEQMMNKKK